MDRHEKALSDYYRSSKSDAPERFEPEPNFLYRYFNEDGFLLYLGITRRIHERDTAHWQAIWRPLAHYMFVETFPTRRLVEAAEFRAYEAESPHFNCMIPYRAGFEAVTMAWYGRRTGGKWVGYNPQWFAMGKDGLACIEAPGWWDYGRPQIPEDTFVDPRQKLRDEAVKIMRRAYADKPETNGES